jgi:effector-binding domain-containing protein
MWGTDTMAIEKAEYKVLEREGDIDVRQYEPHIVAVTIVEGDFEEIGNEGFRRLADYINGNNRKKQSISMTAPVTQEASSEKIAMTAPVGQERAGGKWRITFVMPNEYTMDTLPEPLDSRVTLKEEPGQLMAAIRYSGTWSRAGYEKHKAILEEFIERRGLTVIGEPVWARYNPPFLPWFLRRNEVLIPVAR